MTTESYMQEIQRYFKDLCQMVDKIDLVDIIDTANRVETVSKGPPLALAKAKDQAVAILNMIEYGKDNKCFFGDEMPALVQIENTARKLHSSLYYAIYGAINSESTPKEQRPRFVANAKAIAKRESTLLPVAKFTLNGQNVSGECTRLIGLVLEQYDHFADGNFLDCNALNPAIGRAAARVCENVGLPASETDKHTLLVQVHEYLKPNAPKVNNQ